MSEQEKVDGRSREGRAMRENRAPETRDTEIRHSEKKTRRKKKDTDNELTVDPAEIPDGFTVEWKRVAIYGKEDNKNMIGLEKDGWEPANPKDFPSLVGKNHRGATIVNGQGDLMLMIRPIELTQEARQEDLSNARNQVRSKFEEIGMATPGQAPRVDSAGNKLTKIRAEYGPIAVE